MAYVSDLNSPSKRLLQGIMERVNALGDSPKVIVELDKLSYVPGFRRKYDAVQYITDTVVSDLLSIDKAEKITDYTDGTELSVTTELTNVYMSMPIRTSKTMSGKSNDELHIMGMRITDWFDTDPRCSRKKHKGIDLDLAIGDPVYAVWDGTVSYAQTNGGYGKVVYIDHGNGWQTRYAHLNKISVSKGASIAAGEMVGYGGNSGHIITSGGGDGSHLHFEVRKEGTPLNPEPFLRGQKTIQAPSKAPSAAPAANRSSAGVMDSSASAPVEYNIEATAYTARCTGCTGITRGGTDVRTWKNWKIIAVDPSLIPLGSRVELIVDGVNWGEYLADDTGGDIKGHRIDILMETNAKALEFGRRQVIARVISFGDGKRRVSTGDDGSVRLGNELVTYQVNRTTSKQTFYQDYSKKPVLNPAKFTGISGAEQFYLKDGTEQFGVLGFRTTANAGAGKSFVFEHDWFHPGNLGWAYIADLDPDDRVTVKVDGYLMVTINGVNAKQGTAYPPSIPVPKGHHTVEIAFANPSKASAGKFGILYLRAREFDVETVEQKQVWDFTDEMNSPGRWTPYGTVIQSDKGSYQAISTSGGEAGIERGGKVNRFPLTLNFRIKVKEGTSGKVVVANGAKVFVIHISDSSVSTNGGAYPIDNTNEFVEYTATFHDETDMDLYVKKTGSAGTEQWVNTGIRGSAGEYSMNRILFAVSSGELYIDTVNYSANDYAIEQFATHIASSYQSKWYEVGDFVYEDTYTIDLDVMNWEVNNHLDMASATARITLDNSKGKYTQTWERKPEFPESYKVMESPLTYYEEGELVHVISEGTPIRIYAGYGEEVVRIFTGVIKGEIQEDSEARTVTFSCVDKFDMLEEFVFYKPMAYPPEEAYAGDNGAFAWIKSSIVEDIAVAAGFTSWKIHAEDLMYPDYVIDDTVYIDVNKGKNTFMKFNKESGELAAVTQEDIMTVGGWQNPFVASVTFPVGTRASDAIASLIEDIPYLCRCDRYGTFRMMKMDFLDYADWQVQDGKKWDFIDGENLISLNAPTDYSGVRNHLMISGSSGIVEHFFDKSLIIATKGSIRTAGIQESWLEEADGASMRGAKEAVASKVFFDIKRQARTKNVVVKGNPLIELLDAVYVYDSHTYTANYFLVKGNRITGNAEGIVNYLELTWQTLTQGA
ncbi:peptidoglycan DD-metalloendopeptidase family protein [Paenibacillus tengchongensis]|uniref:peptidoglycan DD-metalloendopeptidase family protein n=1 Tax=Paenibacillus tengchongensis TaxID=2608684 RepID=UPI00124C1B7D|nr:peptidoglycan DD-metalloendopeptidase family protein [Paenibacillus tengchongensis]